MAVDIISPRISFSHNLTTTTTAATTTVTTGSTTTTATFDFCIPLNPNSPVITSADELFLNGVILPTQIKKPKPAPKENEDLHRKRLKELLSDQNDEEQEQDQEQEQEKPATRSSFWKFTRTASLNSGNANSGVPKRLIRSLSLKRLLNNSSRKEISSSSGRFSCNGNDSRWRSKDSGDGNQRNSVLNVPAGYNVNLFGYGALFCKGKPKSKSISK